MRDIIFQPAYLEALQLQQPPLSAKSFIPEWFRKTPLFVGENSSSTNSTFEAMRHKDKQATYKLCIPFIDAMTSGYIITLPASIYVYQEKNEFTGEYHPILKWEVTWQLADKQENSVATNMPLPYKHSQAVFRWYTNWTIQTPVGYSSFFSHPANRYDLPFTTISGIVDTDKHPNPLLFPFFIREGFEGEIPQGTPIAQILPFKREKWQSKINKELNPNKVNAIKQTIFRTYKKLYWSKKFYD